MNIAKFVWDDMYSVGIKEIDEQHKHYFGLMNAIYDHLLSGKAKKEDWVSSISELCDYSLYHFSTEEEFLKKFGCDGTDQHIKIHDAFRTKVKNFMERAMGSDDMLPALATEVANYSKDWLIHHILIVDKGYTQCFHVHGKY